MILIESIEVFGLEHPIDWPAGTAVEVLDLGTNTATVVGPGGVVVTLPRRVLGDAKEASR